MILAERDTTAAKGLAILLVLAYHSAGWLQIPNYFQGQVGVDLFVLASGYGIGRGAAKYTGRPFTFLQRRLSRLYPEYAIVILLIALFGAVTWPDLLTHLLMIHGAFPAYFFGATDNAYWFMSFIFFCYVFVAATNVRALQQHSLLLGALLSAPFFVLFFTEPSINAHMLARFPEFFIAYWFARSAEFGGDLQRPPLVRATEAAVITAFYLWAVWQMPGVFYNAGLTAGAVVMFMGLRNLPWAKDRLIIVGAWSFEVYLVHDPILRHIATSLRPVEHWGPFFGTLVFTVAAIVPIVLCSMMLRSGGNAVASMASRMRGQMLASAVHE